MIKINLSVILIALSVGFCNLKTYAQSDTTKSSTTKGITYLEIYYSLTNTPGTFAGRSNLSLEYGKQWDVFSLGFDVGKTTLETIHGSRDTSVYLEIRPNLNIFQQGRFTNTLTVGAGYIFAAKENFLTELTSGIEYTANDNIHLNVDFGQFYYSGRYTAESNTFFGVSLTYYFLPYKSRSSIIKPRD